MKIKKNIDYIKIGKTALIGTTALILLILGFRLFFNDPVADKSLSINITENSSNKDPTIDIGNASHNNYSRDQKKYSPEPPPLMSKFLQKKGDLKEPWEYKEDGECEFIAKMYQKEYGGYLVYVAPFKKSDKAWITCKFCGLWLNLIDKDNKSYYVDYQFQKVFTDKFDAVVFYTDVMKSRYNTNDLGVRLYTYTVDQMPYPIFWSY